MKREPKSFLSSLLTAILFLEWTVPPPSAFALRTESTRQSAGLKDLKAGLEEVSGMEAYRRKVEPVREAMKRLGVQTALSPGEVWSLAQLAGPDGFLLLKPMDQKLDSWIPEQEGTESRHWRAWYPMVIAAQVWKELTDLDSKSRRPRGERRREPFLGHLGFILGREVLAHEDFQTLREGQIPLALENHVPSGITLQEIRFLAQGEDPDQSRWALPQTKLSMREAVERGAVAYKTNVMLPVLVEGKKYDSFWRRHQESKLKWVEGRARSHLSETDGLGVGYVSGAILWAAPPHDFAPELALQERMVQWETSEEKKTLEASEAFARAHQALTERVVERWSGTPGITLIMIAGPYFVKEESQWEQRKGQAEDAIRRLAQVNGGKAKGKIVLLSRDRPLKVVQEELALMAREGLACGAAPGRALLRRFVDPRTGRFRQMSGHMFKQTATVVAATLLSFFDSIRTEERAAGVWEAHGIALDQAIELIRAARGEQLAGLEEAPRIFEFDVPVTRATPSSGGARLYAVGPEGGGTKFVHLGKTRRSYRFDRPRRIADVGLFGLLKAAIVDERRVEVSLLEGARPPLKYDADVADVKFSMPLDKRFPPLMREWRMAVALPDRVEVRNLSTGEVELLIRIREGGPVKGVSLSADGRIFAAGFGTPEIQLHRAEKMRPAVLRHSAPVTDFTLTPHLLKELKLAAAAAETVTVWSVRTQEELESDPKLAPEMKLFECRHNAPVGKVAFSADGRILAASTLAASTLPNQLVLWDASTGERLAALPLPAPATDISFSLRGALTGAKVAVAMGGREAALWDVPPEAARRMVRIERPFEYPRGSKVHAEATLPEEILAQIGDEPMRWLRTFGKGGVKRWGIRQGMGYRDPDTWWSSHAARPGPHAGLDFVDQETPVGGFEPVPVGTGVPAMFDGQLVLAFPDSMQYTLLIETRLKDRFGRSLVVGATHVGVDEQTLAAWKGKMGRGEPVRIRSMETLGLLQRSRNPRSVVAQHLHKTTGLMKEEDRRRLWEEGKWIDYDYWPELDRLVDEGRLTLVNPLELFELEDIDQFFVQLPRRNIETILLFHPVKDGEEGEEGKEGRNPDWALLRQPIEARFPAVRTLAAKSWKGARRYLDGPEKRVDVIIVNSPELERGVRDAHGDRYPVIVCRGDIDEETLTTLDRINKAGVLHDAPVPWEKHREVFERHGLRTVGDVIDVVSDPARLTGLHLESEDHWQLLEVAARAAPQMLRIEQVFPPVQGSDADPGFFFRTLGVQSVHFDNHVKVRNLAELVELYRDEKNSERLALALGRSWNAFVLLGIATLASPKSIPTRVFAALLAPDYRDRIEVLGKDLAELLGRVCGRPAELEQAFPNPYERTDLLVALHEVAPHQEVAKLLGRPDHAAVLQDSPALMERYEQSKIGSPPTAGLEEGAAAKKLLNRARDRTLPTRDREKALQDLGAMGPKAKTAVEPLRKMMIGPGKDPNPGIRYAAIQALAAIGYPVDRAVEDLFSLVRDLDSLYFRASAVATLKKTVQRDLSIGLPLVRRGLSSKDTRVATAARIVLQDLGEALPEPRPAPPQASRPPPQPQPPAPPPAEPQLVAVPQASRPPPPVAPGYAEPMVDLQRQLVHSDWRVRLAAAKSLGALGAAAAPAIQSLIETSTDDEVAHVRRAGVAALENIARSSAGEDRKETVDGLKRVILSSMEDASGAATAALIRIERSAAGLEEQPSAAYDRAWDNPRMREVHSQLLSELGDLSGQTVLEIGCGTGIGTELLAGAVGRNGRVIAADLSEEMLVRAAQRVEPRGNVEFFLGDGMRLGALQDLVDGIVLFNGVHLVEDLPAALQEWMRHLRPGGWIAFNTTFFSKEGAFGSTDLRGALREEVEREILLRRPGLALKRVVPPAFSPREYERFFRREGFRDVSCRESGTQATLDQVIRMYQIPGFLDAWIPGTGLSLSEQQEVVRQAVTRVFTDRKISSVDQRWLHAVARKPASGLEEGWQRAMDLGHIFSAVAVDWFWSRIREGTGFSDVARGKVRELHERGALKGMWAGGRMGAEEEILRRIAQVLTGSTELPLTLTKEQESLLQITPLAAHTIVSLWTEWSEVGEETVLARVEEWAKEMGDEKTPGGLLDDDPWWRKLNADYSSIQKETLGRFGALAPDRKRAFIRRVLEAVGPAAGLEEPAKPLFAFGGHSKEVHAAAFHPDGALFATGGKDNRILFRKAASRKTEPAGAAPGQVSAMTFSPNGKLLATGTFGGTVKLWEKKDGKWEVKWSRLGKKEGSHQDDILRLAFSPDSATLLSASRDGTLRLWSAYRDDPQGVSPGSGRPLAAADFYPAGAGAVVGDTEGNVELLLLSMGEWTSFGKKPPPMRGIFLLAFQPDGRQLFSVDAEKDRIKIWSTSTGLQVGVLRGHPQAVTALAFAPEAGMLISGDQEGNLFVWDVDRHALQASFRGHGAEVLALAAAPDGTLFVSAAGDGTVHLWNLADLATQPAASVKDAAAPLPAESSGASVPASGAGMAPLAEAPEAAVSGPSEDEIDAYVLEHSDCWIKTAGTWNEPRLRTVLHRNPAPLAASRMDVVVKLLHAHGGEVRVLPLSVLKRGVRFRPEDGTLNLARETLEQADLGLLADALRQAEFALLLRWADSHLLETAEPAPQSPAPPASAEPQRSKKLKRAARITTQAPRSAATATAGAATADAAATASAPAGPAEPQVEVGKILSPLALKRRLVEAVDTALNKRTLLPNQVIQNESADLVAVDTTDGREDSFVLISLNPKGSGFGFSRRIRSPVPLVPTAGMLGDPRAVPARYAATLGGEESLAEIRQRYNPASRDLEGKLVSLVEKLHRDREAQNRGEQEEAQAVARIREGLALGREVINFPDLEPGGRTPEERLRALPRAHPDQAEMIRKALDLLMKVVFLELDFAEEMKGFLSRVMEGQQDGQVPARVVRAALRELLDAAPAWPVVTTELEAQILLLPEDRNVTRDWCLEIVQILRVAAHQGAVSSVLEEVPGGILQAIYYDGVRTALLAEADQIEEELGRPRPPEESWDDLAFRTFDLLAQVAFTEAEAAITRQMRQSARAEAAEHSVLLSPYGGIGLLFFGPEGRLRWVPGGGSQARAPQFGTHFDVHAVRRWIRPEEKTVALLCASFTGWPNVEQWMAYCTNCQEIQASVPGPPEVWFGTVTPDGSVRLWRPKVNSLEKERWGEAVRPVLDLADGFYNRLRDHFEKAVIEGFFDGTQELVRKFDRQMGKAGSEFSRTLAASAMLRGAEELNRIPRSAPRVLEEGFRRMGFKEEDARQMLAAVRRALPEEFLAISRLDIRSDLEETKEKLPRLMRRVLAAAGELLARDLLDRSELFEPVEIPGLTVRAAQPSEATPQDAEKVVQEKVEELVRQAVAGRGRNRGWELKEVQVFGRRWAQEPEISKRLAGEGKKVMQAEFNRAYEARKRLEDAAADQTRKVSERAERQVAELAGADGTQLDLAERLLAESKETLAALQGDQAEQGNPAAQGEPAGRLEEARAQLAGRCLTHAVREAGIGFEGWLKSAEADGAAANENVPDLPGLQRRLEAASRLAEGFPRLESRRPEADAARLRLGVMDLHRRLAQAAASLSFRDVERAEGLLVELAEMDGPIETLGDEGKAVSGLLNDATARMARRMAESLQMELKTALYHQPDLERSSALLAEVNPAWGLLEGLLAEAGEVRLNTERIVTQLRLRVEELARADATQRATGADGELQVNTRQQEVEVPAGEAVRLTHRLSGRSVLVTFTGQVREVARNVRLAQIRVKTPLGLMAVSGNELTSAAFPAYNDENPIWPTRWRGKTLTRRYQDQQREIQGSLRTLREVDLQLRDEGGRVAEVEHTLWVFGLTEFGKALDDERVVLGPTTVEEEINFADFLSDLRIRVRRGSLAGGGGQRLSLLVEDPLDLYLPAEVVDPVLSTTGLEEAGPPQETGPLFSGMVAGLVPGMKGARVIYRPEGGAWINAFLPMRNVFSGGTNLPAGVKGSWLRLRRERGESVRVRLDHVEPNGEHILALAEDQEALRGEIERGLEGIRPAVSGKSAVRAKVVDIAPGKGADVLYSDERGWAPGFLPFDSIRLEDGRPLPPQARWAWLMSCVGETLPLYPVEIRPLGGDLSEAVYEARLDPASVRERAAPAVWELERAQQSRELVPVRAEWVRIDGALVLYQAEAGGSWAGGVLPLERLSAAGASFDERYANLKRHEGRQLWARPVVVEPGDPEPRIEFEARLPLETTPSPQPVLKKGSIVEGKVVRVFGNHAGAEVVFEAAGGAKIRAFLPMRELAVEGGDPVWIKEGWLRQRRRRGDRSPFKVIDLHGTSRHSVVLSRPEVLSFKELRGEMGPALAELRGALLEQRPVEVQTRHVSRTGTVVELFFFGETGWAMGGLVQSEVAALTPLEIRPRTLREWLHRREGARLQAIPVKVDEQSDPPFVRFGVRIDPAALRAEMEPAYLELKGGGDRSVEVKVLEVRSLGLDVLYAGAQGRWVCGFVPKSEVWSAGGTPPEDYFASAQPYRGHSLTVVPKTVRWEDGQVEPELIFTARLPAEPPPLPQAGLEEPSVAKLLARLDRMPNTRDRLRTVARLGRMGAKAAAAVGPLRRKILGGTRDSAGLVRARAITALERIGYPSHRVVPDLLEVRARDPDPEVRQHAEATLKRLAKKDTGIKALLEQATKSADRELAAAAASVLASLLASRAFPDVPYPGASPAPSRPQVVLDGRTPLGELAEHLKDPDAHVRMRAATLLGRRRGREARRAAALLREALRDRVGNVRQYAATALARLQGHALPDIPELLRLRFEDDYTRVKVAADAALRKLARVPGASLYFAEALQSQDDQVRELAQKLQKLAAGLEEPGDLGERVEETVVRLEQNVVVLLNEELLSPADLSRLTDPGHPALVWMAMRMRQDILPWPKERSVDLQVDVVSNENRERLLQLYSGWKVIEVKRRPGAVAGFLPAAALPRVVAEALAAGADVLEIDAASYDVGGMTLDDALENLRRLIFA